MLVKSAQEVRIVLTGGGTGGHVVPLLAVARELIVIMPQLNLRYIGGNGFSESIFRKDAIEVDIISAGKWRRYFSLQNITDVFKTFAGVLQALWKLYWYMPDVVFSKGGYGAFPVLVAARFFRIPIVVHESDSVPGLVNRWGGRFAKRVAVAFPYAQEYFPKGKTAVVGNPVRRSFTQNLEPQGTAKKRFGFDESHPVLLVLGGSQGSARINDFTLGVLLELIKRFQILHQVGEQNVKEMHSESALTLERLGKDEAARYKIYGFFQEDEYRDAFNAADIIVSRAGSGAIFEIAAFAKPSALIPLKESAGDHQRLNALDYFKAGCCIYFEEENLLPHLFIEQLSELLINREKRTKMVEACKMFAKPDAAEVIARELLTIARA